MPISQIPNLLVKQIFDFQNSGENQNSINRHSVGMQISAEVNFKVPKIHPLHLPRENTWFNGAKFKIPLSLEALISSKLLNFLRCCSMAKQTLAE